jgi:hypothetical protein
MNKTKSLLARCSPVVGLFVLLSLGGCKRPIGELELTAYKDPVSPQTFDVKLWEGAYYVEPGGDYHIVGRSVHQPAGGAGTGEITQLVHIHMFWRPRPGKTFANSSMIDAVLRYAIVTDQGAALYDGTACVFVKKTYGGKLKITLEGGRLQLSAQDGTAPEILGAARVEGELTAGPDSSLALQLRREIDLRAGQATPVK